MPLYFIIIIGVILFSVLAVFWLLIVLDLENQKNLEIFMPSKVKDSHS